MNGPLPAGARIVVPAGPVNPVVLDRVVDIAQQDTPYCVHGRTTCVSCGHWCWLGDRTHDLVLSGGCAPMCQPCATRYLPPGVTRSSNVGDHRRADGPH